MKKVSIVTLNYKNSQDTVHCVKSLINQNYPNISIIVVDNSEDEKYINEIYEELKNKEFEIKKIDEDKIENFKGLDFKKEIILVKAKENRGFSAGNNIGIRLALKNNSDYIWILNNDTEVEKNTINHMLDISVSHNIPVVTCKIKDFYQKDKVQFNGEITYYCPIDDIPDKIKAPKILTGANMFLKKEVFEKIGLFDEDFFLYFEDNDFFNRICLNKILVVYTPFTHIYHKGGSSIGKYLQTPVSAYYMSRNTFLIKEKASHLKSESFKNCIDDLLSTYLNNIKNKKILRAILLGLYDFLKGKKGKQENLDYYINLKPDKTKVEIKNLSKIKEIYQNNKENIYLNELLAEKYKNNLEKKLEPIFMLALLNPRKEKYYKQFFETAKEFIEHKSYQKKEKTDGKKSFSMYNQN